MKKAAEIIRNQGAVIIETWERKVKNEISAAHSTSTLALRNQLPKVLEDISFILDRYEGTDGLEDDENFHEIIQNSLDHGRHRATSSHYTVKQILQEYIVFHKVLTETLVSNDVYSSQVGIVLKYTLETAMLNSAGSFSDSLQEMREKLIGTLAHDLRNPISTAHFALDMIKHYRDDEKRFDDMRQMGLKSLKKSTELLEGLLDAITVKAGEGITLNFDEVDLLDDISWVYDEASEIYTNKINFNKKEADSLKGVFDGTAVRRVVENLVTNAIKYGAREKPVTITVEDSDKDIRVSVHNYGNPIAKKDQENIFEFLNRSSERNSGNLDSWGMGLTLVKTVANAHGGKLMLNSNEKEGTTFTLILDKFSHKPGKIRTELNFSEN